MHKYFKNHKKDRIRIPSPDVEYLEMHRAARIDFFSKKIEKKIKKHLNLSKLNRYPKVEELYKKLAKFNNINEENILITSGIDGAIKSVFEMCTSKNSNIICLTPPTYAMYHVYSEAFETNIIEIKTDEKSLKIEIESIINKMNQDIDVIFIPNPHQPIENVFSLKELETIITEAKKYDILVFIDEAYFMYDAPTALPLIHQYDNIVVARTFSKGFGLPGIRIGYLLGNKDIIEYLSSKRFAHETSSVSCEIAIWALDNISTFLKYTKTVCKTRTWLKKKLHKHGFSTHGEMSNTILINLNTNETVKRFALELEKERILVRSNIPIPFENFIMVTIGSKAKTSIFLNKFLEINDKVKNEKEIY